MPTIEIVRATPPQLARCGSPSCGKVIEWVTTVASGKRMPVESPLVVAEKRTGRDGKPVTVIDSAQSHFVRCPSAGKYRKPKPPRKEPTLFEE